MRTWAIVFVVLLIAAALLSACSDDPLGYSYKDLPTGDAARGATVFTARCASCHALDEGRGPGPSLAGYGATAGSRVKNQSAADYTFNSILRPSKHLVQGFSNVMPSDYDEKLSRQEIADLIAYLLAL
ncbi:MAG: cytochrome c [Anaerolineae bacterium]|nr:cytochrome c [Anaerolineae bacterium]